MEKDLSEVKKRIKGWKFRVYKKTVDAVYSMFIEHLGKKILKNYNPKYEENKATFYEENKDLKALEKDKEEFENFIYGDISKVKETRFFNKAMSNRIVSMIYKKFQAFTKDKNAVLTFFNAMSLILVWEIIE